MRPIVAALSLSFALRAAAADPAVKHERYTLPNGLTVILSEDHRLPQVAVNVWYHVGAANQTPGRSGFAHLFEHMMFSGSKHVQPSPFAYLERIGVSAGAMANGSTNFDRTNYYETVPSSELATALWIESDRMAYLLDTLDEKKLAIQRDVVSNERRQSYENRPYGTAELARCDLLYPSPHPYFNCVIGKIDDIQAASLDDLRGFFRSWYGPANASLAIVGDFDPAEAKALVGRYFGPVPGGPAPAREDVPLPRLEREVRRTVPDAAATVPALELAWNGVRRFSDDEAAGDVLATILGDGRTSRLYRALVFDRKVATGTSAFDVGLGLGGWFGISAVAREGHDPAALLAEAQRVVDAMRRDGPTAAEVARARRKIVAGMIRGLERIGGRADQLNAYETYTGDPGFLAKDLARYRAVTPAAVKAFAEKYLPDDRRLVLEVVPASAKATGTATSTPTPTPPVHPERSAGGAESKGAGAESKGPSETDPTLSQKPPPLDRPIAFAAPVPVERTLPNGLRLLVVENHAVPVTAVEVLVRAGVDAVPPRQAGLAELTAAMLTEGTRTRSATRIAEEVEDLAAHLHASAGLEGTRVHLNALTETLPAALTLLADVVVEPAFRPEDLERVRAEHLTELTLKRGRPQALARDELARVVYGARHPWGQPSGGTPETVRALRPADLAAFHARAFRPNDAVVIVTGDVAPDDAARLVGKAFAAWRKGPVRRPALPPFPEPGARAVALVDRPGASQSQVWVGGRIFAARDPDAVPLFVANDVVGGLFTSRLNMNLREAKGYSYGVRSQVQLNGRSGIFLAAGGVVAKSTADAVAEYEKELQRFASGEVTEAELAQAKAAQLRGLPSRLETNDAVASAVATLVLHGLPLDWYRTLPARIEAVTAADVARVARRWVTPGRWPIVVVGPRSLAEEGLRALRLGALDVRPGAPPVPAR
ncbi:MAG: M16 family metallopeptidase [Anaeromyxobacteraceae bacterium]